MLLSSCISQEWTLLNRISCFDFRAFIESDARKIFWPKTKDKHSITKKKKIRQNQWIETHIISYIHKLTSIREAFKELVVFFRSNILSLLKWTYGTTSASLHLCQSLFGRFSLCVFCVFAFGKLAFAFHWNRYHNLTTKYFAFCSYFFLSRSSFMLFSTLHFISYENTMVIVYVTLRYACVCVIFG